MVDDGRYCEWSKIGPGFEKHRSRSWSKQLVSLLLRCQRASHCPGLGTVWNKWGGSTPFLFRNTQTRTIQMLQPRIDGWVTFRKKIGAANGEPANAYWMEWWIYGYHTSNKRSITTTNHHPRSFLPCWAPVSQKSTNIKQFGPLNYACPKTDLSPGTFNSFMVVIFFADVNMRLWNRMQACLYNASLYANKVG